MKCVGEVRSEVRIDTREHKVKYTVTYESTRLNIFTPLHPLTCGEGSEAKQAKQITNPLEPFDVARKLNEARPL